MKTKPDSDSDGSENHTHLRLYFSNCLANVHIVNWHYYVFTGEKLSNDIYAKHYHKIREIHY